MSATAIVISLLVVAFVAIALLKAVKAVRRWRGIR